MKVSYNWLENYFESKLPSPREIEEALLFHSFEVEKVEEINIGNKKDYIFDIKILPDRAHDCLSHWGIAKEIGAIFDIKLVYKNSFEKYLATGSLSLLSDPVANSEDTKLEINIQSENCIRYMGRIVKGIEVKESPLWLKESLESIGQKSINILVDVANFLMFDIGQPIHIFDLDKLEGKKIVIEKGEKNEKIITLDKREIQLDESVLLIKDSKDPLAIAGIKGGDKAEVSENTKNIVIEVANFEAKNIRRTSRKIGIYTDAVKRYENEIHPEFCEITMNLISKFIYSLSGGQFEDIVDVYKDKEKYNEIRKINITTNFINKFLGSSFNREEIGSVFKKLKFEYLNNEDDFEVSIPFYRADLEIKENLTEEVGRILGYEKLEPILPKFLENNKKIDQDILKIILAKRKMIKDGYSEVMTYTFRKSGEVGVLASASDKNFLRSNLKDGLMESLKLNTLNAPLLGEGEIKIFEVGTIFKKDREEIHVAWNEKKEIKEMTLDNFYILKNFTHESTDIKNQNPLAKNQVLGSALPQPDHDFLREDFLLDKNSNKFKMWSLYPFIVRDIALWVPLNTESKEVENIIKNEINDLVVSGPELFDSFKKDGKISYAFRLIFQSYERTLTIEEVNILVEKIIQRLKENKNWEIR